MSENLFLRDKYDLNREKVLHSYKNSMVMYISSLHPEMDTHTIESYVEDVIKEKIHIPSITYNDSTTSGTSIPVKASLVNFLTNNVKDNIFSTFGSVYEKSENKESFLKKTIKDKIKERSEYKKAMFEATDEDTITMYNIKQSITKIVMNSIIGAMESEYSFIYDSDGFSSVTSISRHCVKYGFAHVERLVGGNLYLLGLDDALQYCMQLKKHLPPNVTEIIKKYRLYQPTPNDVLEWLKESLLKYNRYDTINFEALHTFLSTLDDNTLGYIYYASNLKNIFFRNDVIVKNFIRNLFRKDIDCSDVDIGNFNFKKYDETLLTMLKLTHSELIGKNPETRHMYSWSESAQNNPEGLKQFIACILHVDRIITSMDDFIKCFLVMDNDIINITNHDRMLRVTVIRSDTDSVIFTLMDMVKWYSGKISLTEDGKVMNAFVVYLISKTLENVFARQSRLFGASVEDQHLIGMKNEFFYPVMLTTPIKKTYAGLIYAQEGNILSKIKTDIKGVALKSSNLSGKVINLVKDTITKILEDSMNDAKIDTLKLLENVSDVEYNIFNGIKDGEVQDYLPISSVKPKEQYKKPDASLYRCYELWQAVFADKYGDIHIPSKVYCIPIKGAKGKYIKSEEYMSWLKATNRNIHDNLIKYINDNDYDITRIIFPMNVRIPVEIHKLLSIERLIYTNCKPLYLVLNSLGMAYAYQNKARTKTVLVSSYYRSEKNKNTLIE